MRYGSAASLERQPVGPFEFGDTLFEQVEPVEDGVTLGLERVEQRDQLGGVALQGLLWSLLRRWQRNRSPGVPSQEFRYINAAGANDKGRSLAPIGAQRQCP